MRRRSGEICFLADSRTRQLADSPRLLSSRAGGPFKPVFGLSGFFAPTFLSVIPDGNLLFSGFAAFTRHPAVPEPKDPCISFPPNRSQIADN
jgi:hypothetical protein